MPEERPADFAALPRQVAGEAASLPAYLLLEVGPHIQWLGREPART